MSTTTYVIVPAPGHYGDVDRVYSAHASTAAARRALRAAGARFVCRESSLRRGAKWLRVYEETSPVVSL